MASRKTKRTSIIQIIGLIVAVALIVTISILFQNWWTKRPKLEPKDVTIVASAPAGKLTISPFSVCEPGVKCDENQVPVLKVGADEELTITVPEEIANHDWQLLTIYDDPAANDQFNHGSHDATEVKVPGSASPLVEGGERPKLVVVEVSSILIGHDSEGTETPYTVTWSLSTVENPA